MTGRPSSKRNVSESRFARTSPGNQLLARLPVSIRQQFTSQLHRVSLKTGQSLFRAHERLGTAYFPESAVISLMARSADGQLLEVGIVGKDGMAGIALIPGVNMLPYEGNVQIGGTALQIAAEPLKEAVRQEPQFHQLLGRYAYSVFADGVQTAVCNNFHPIKQRCARWLLMLHDVSGGDAFPLTQNLLALMLGVRRPSVTLAAGALQQRQLVEYHRGRMTIRDRSGLEADSCDCYRLMREEKRRLLGY